MKIIQTYNFTKHAEDYNTYPGVKKEPETMVTNLFLNTTNDDTEESIIDLWEDPKKKNKKVPHRKIHE